MRGQVVGVTVWAACCLSVADAQLAQAQPPQFGPNAAAGASISANNWPAMQAVSVSQSVRGASCDFPLNCFTPLRTLAACLSLGSYGGRRPHTLLANPKYKGCVDLDFDPQV